VFWVATGLIAVETTLFTLVVPALPVFAERYSLSDSEAALIFAAFPVAQLASAFASARPVERHGRRPAILFAGVLLLLATLAFALVSDPLPLAAARSIQGVAAGLPGRPGSRPSPTSTRTRSSASGSASRRPPAGAPGCSGR